MPFDFSNVKSLTIPVNGVQKEVKQITDGNGVIIWKKLSDVVVIYTINTGVASITIRGNDNVTYVNAATTSGSVNIPKGITITCSATVQTGYNTISNTTKILDGDYTYSPTTSLKLYTVTLNSVYGHWENSSGTTVTSVQNVPHGTAISANDTYHTVTITGFGTYTFKVNTDTAQYHYAFNRIDWDGASTKVTANKNVYGRATRTVRQYVVYFTNTGNYTVTFYVNGTGYSVGPNRTGGSPGVPYGTEVSVYFTGQDVTSSTKTFTLTTAKYFTGGISATYHHDWTPTNTLSYRSTGRYGVNSYFSSDSNWNGAGDQNVHAWYRSTSATKIRFTWDWESGVVYEGDIPSGVPSITNSDYSQWIWYQGQEYAFKVWYASSNQSGKYVCFKLNSYEGDDETDAEQVCEVGITTSNTKGDLQNPDWIYKYDGTNRSMKLEYGYYNDYYTYSPYWS